MRTKILLVLLSLQLAGCSTIVQQLSQDRRDAPWDPKGSASLMDQIPNEDGGAMKRCCGHLRVCQAHQTPRC
jgi:starvation-inducible outer membrane lipoprotein